MSVNLVVLCGLQASGKSTFRRAYLPDHEVVSKDMMGSSKRKEARQRRLIVEALEAGRDVVVDNTNPSVEERASILEVAPPYGARVVVYYFESNLADCFARNAERADREVVPPVGIRATRSRLVLPSPEEGFGELWYVRMAGGGAFEVTPWNLEEAANG